MTELKKEIQDFKYEPGMPATVLVDKLGSVGYQSIQLKRAAEVIKKMKREKAKIILTFTSNMVSSGLRGFFAQLIEKKFVDVVITTAGSVEEDMIKAHKAKFFVGSFNADDAKLGEEGINRIGNIYVTNEAYGSFEKIFSRILAELYKEKKVWRPSQLIRELGRFVKDENSFVYQARKQGVSVYCPAITDGALGMQAFFFQQEQPGFEISVVKDVGKLVQEAVDAEKVGVIALGGGAAKHHAIMACLMRNGMEYAVYMTTAHSHAGSLSGATTEEAKSWGKIKDDADAVTVTGDVTVTFPLVMSNVLSELDA
ncbi:MAG: deoxyhypusine synthase [Candidatus Micrarchaeia archaeon]